MRIREYILRNFIFDQRGELKDDQSLLRSGVVDSTGILELIAFTEEEFDVHFEDTELVADNFDSVNRVTACVIKKINRGETVSGVLGN